MHFKEDMSLLLKSGCPFIYVISDEEERLEYVLKKIAHSLHQAIYFWDFIQGYRSDTVSLEQSQKNPLQALEFIASFNSNSDAIFVLYDFHLFFNDPSVTRKLRNLSKRLKVCGQNIIISAAEISTLTHVNDLLSVINFPSLSMLEIKSEFTRVLQSLGQSYKPDLLDNLALSCKGLSLQRIRLIIAKLLVTFRTIDNSSLSLIATEKQQQVKQDTILELCHDNFSLDSVGGIATLKTWLFERSQAFSAESTAYGLSYPKGILLVGIQGTGKTMSAKAIANHWHLPLLKLDVGKLFASLVGESEAKVRKMIRVAEASSPCVLLIDEIDKVFNKNMHGGDSGTSGRVFATFISWLSDKKKPVFVVATANSVEYLPLEMIRKGRFDEIFFLGLPTLAERMAIFQIQLAKVRPYTWNRYNIGLLAQYSDLFSGAEIEQAILDSMYSAFSENREFTSQDILKSISFLVPLAFTDSSAIIQLQQWADLGKARFASGS